MDIFNYDYLCHWWCKLHSPVLSLVKFVASAMDGMAFRMIRSSPKEIFVWFHKCLECEESSQVVKWLFHHSFIPWMIDLRLKPTCYRGPVVLSQGKTWRRRSIWRCQPFCRWVLCSVRVWALYPMRKKKSLVVQCFFMDKPPSITITCDDAINAIEWNVK